MSQSHPIINEPSIKPTDADNSLPQFYTDAGEEFWTSDDERTRVRLLRKQVKAKGMKRPTVYQER